MSDLAPEVKFSLGADEFLLKPASIESEIHYTRFLKNRAFEELRASRSVLGEDYDRLLMALVREQTIGVYEWGQEVWLRSLYLDAHMSELAYLCFKQSHPGLGRKKFAELWKLHEYQTEDGRRAHKIVDAIWEFFARPNCRTPVAAATG